MFGRKKEAEYNERFNNFKSSVKQINGRVSDTLINIKENAKGMREALESLREKNDTAKKDLAYLNSLSNTILEDAISKNKRVGDLVTRAKKMTEAISNKEVFDIDRLNKSAEKVTDGIRITDQNLNSIREELRSLETISSQLKDFAGQTSALSLNAAIVGARIDKGEAGFVQTATEIKELAAECSKVIIELNRKIEKIESCLDDAGKGNMTSKEGASEGNAATSAIVKAYNNISKEFEAEDSDEYEDLNLDKVVSNISDIKTKTELLSNNQEKYMADVDSIIIKAANQIDEGKSCYDAVEEFDETV